MEQDLLASERCQRRALYRNRKYVRKNTDLQCLPRKRITTAVAVVTGVVVSELQYMKVLINVYSQPNSVEEKPRSRNEETAHSR